jgi:hypothetical protein
VADCASCTVIRAKTSCSVQGHSKSQTSAIATLHDQGVIRMKAGVLAHAMLFLTSIAASTCKLLCLVLLDARS